MSTDVDQKYQTIFEPFFWTGFFIPICLLKTEKDQMQNQKNHKISRIDEELQFENYYKHTIFTS